MAEPILCPFCGYKTDSDYGIVLHLETHHPEPGTPSPFVVVKNEVNGSSRRDHGNSESASGAGGPDVEGAGLEDDFVYCPVDGCGEALLLTELEAHVEMHDEEGGDQEESSPSPGIDGSTNDADHSATQTKGASFGTKLSHALRNLEDVYTEVHDRNERKGAKKAWGQILMMPESKKRTAASRKRSQSPERGSANQLQAGKVTDKKLGKAELGPHANEKQMPSWLVSLLQSDGKVDTINRIERNGTTRKVKTCPNMMEGIIPVISQLLELDSNVAYAYVCDPAVRHVSKLRGEGGFCGYRNIQMLSSYIIGAKSLGHEILGGKIPTIFQIQEWIENAWDNGINAQGRVETGGVRGTRKYIGTPEAQAMFVNLGITCDAQAFKTKKGYSPKQAYELILSFVESYFTTGCKDYDPKVRRTSLPPVYFQHPGHSMTIVGFQKSTDGSRELLVFDPMFHDSPQVLKLVGEDRIRPKRPEDLLKAYRRGSKTLRKYQEFEVLKYVT